MKLKLKKPARFSFAVFVSAAALAAMLSAPLVFAEEGHGGRDRGRGSDDVVTTVRAPGPVTVADDDVDVNEVNEIDDNDINDDRGVDLPAAAGAPQAPVDVRHDDLTDKD